MNNLGEPSWRMIHVDFADAELQDMSCANNFAARARRRVPDLEQVIKAVCANPSSPLFNHYLFEAVATIVKVAPALTTTHIEN